MIMQSTGKPEWLLDPTCRAPSTCESLLGRYQPAWCPWIRVELSRTGDHFVAAWACLEERDGAISWRPTLRDSLMPLKNGYGYAVVDDPFQARRTLRYAYNPARRQFEIQIETGDPPQITRMPLARVPASMRMEASAPGSNAPQSILNRQRTGAVSAGLRIGAALACRAWARLHAGRSEIPESRCLALGNRPHRASSRQKRRLRAEIGRRRHAG